MKPTAALYSRLRRLPLTTKQVNKGFYKGTGTGAMGRHTKHGGYIIEWHKVRTYVVPEKLQDCKVWAHFLFPVCFGPQRTYEQTRLSQLTPFVTKKMRPTKGRFEGDAKGGLSGEWYLAQWKQKNGKY